MDEGAGDRARSGVQVLVGAPAGRVDLPCVELERDVARRVRQVPEDDGARLVRRRRDSADVQQLPRQVVDAAEEDDGERGIGGDRGAHLVRREELAARRRAQADDRVVGLEAVPRRLRADDVGVGGEGRVLDQDAVALPRRPVEARQKDVQVDGERVHVDDLAGLGAEEPRRRAAQLRVHVHPAVVMALDGELGPLRQPALDGRHGGVRPEAERVAGEVGAGPAGRPGRDRELLAPTSGRVRSLEDGLALRAQLDPPASIPGETTRGGAGTRDPRSGSAARTPPRPCRSPRATGSTRSRRGRARPSRSPRAAR